MKTILAVIGALVVIVFGGLFMIGVLGGIAAHNTQTSSENTGMQSVDTPKRAASPIDVSAYRLFADYQGNEVSADARYKGRILLVSGTVTDIKKDFLDKPYIVLGTPNEFMGVHAELRADQLSWASQLQAGQSVSLECEGGTMIMGSPFLKDCVPGERQMPSPLYTPRPSFSEEPAQAPVQTAVYATPAAPQITVDQYEDNFLQQMKAHWVIPAGTPPNIHAVMSVRIAPNGPVYDATVQEPSTHSALDQSCLSALNQMPQVDPTPDGKVLEISFDCTSKSGLDGVAPQPQTQSGLPSSASFGTNFGWYVEVVKRKVAQNWYLQEVDPSTPAGTTAFVQFTVARDGSPENISLARTSSGSPSLDASCLNAVRKVGSFGPLPDGYTDPNGLSVQYHCTYPGSPGPASPPAQLQ